MDIIQSVEGLGRTKGWKKGLNWDTIFFWALTWVLLVLGPLDSGWDFHPWLPCFSGLQVWTWKTTWAFLGPQLADREWYASQPRSPEDVEPCLSYSALNNENQTNAWVIGCTHILSEEHQLFNLKSFTLDCTGLLIPHPGPPPLPLGYLSYCSQEVLPKLQSDDVRPLFRRHNRISQNKK